MHFTWIITVAAAVATASLVSAAPAPAPPCTKKQVSYGTGVEIPSITTATATNSAEPTQTQQCKLVVPKKVVDTIAATVDDHLPIVSTSPARIVRSSTKSRYTAPDAFVAPQCKVIQVQMVARHGTRNPSNGDTSKLIAFQTSIKKTLAQSPPTNAAFAFLNTFQVPASAEQAGLLTTQGVKDHEYLATFFKQNYPSLVSQPSLISWQATNVSRALASGEAFINKLFETSSDKTAAIAFLQSATVPQSIDADLRPYDACKNYIAASDAATSAAPEKVWSKAKFPAVATKIAQLIGTTATLSVDDVSQMFNLCAFENALQGVTSQFCTLFTDADLSLYDFFQDLKNNANEGYPLPINEKLACSLFTTLDANMAKAASDDSCTAPKSVFKFAHEETILPVLTTLGLFRDEIPLAPTMTLDQVAARKLRFSDVASFAGNVIFELQDCGSAGKKDLKVRVLVNQKPVVVPGCDAEACPLEKFRGALKGKIGCDFDGELCANDIGSVGGSAKFKKLEDVPIEQVLDAIKKSA
ncbi:PHOsphatase [Phlyctochytrium planicorne]|nr:PHOsphatase [Phlyctochytrium planicorne]